MNDTGSAPESPATEAPVTAFERRFGHPPGLFVLFFTGMWERFAYYGVRGLLKLYMVNYLFVTLRQTLQGGSYVAVGDPGAVVGWGFIHDLLPATDPEVLSRCVGESMPRLLAGNAATHMAPLAAEAARAVAEQTCAAAPHASMVYGLYSGFIHLTPIFGGILADRVLGRRKAVALGGVLLVAGYFFMSFESAFFLALLLVILGSGAFTPNLYAQIGDQYRKGDPRRDGGFTLFYMGINLGALISSAVCGSLAVVYGWHVGFAAAGAGMGAGLAIYLRGRRYLATETPSMRGLPTSGREEPVLGTLRTSTRVVILVGLGLLNVLFWAVYEQQGTIMASLAGEQAASPSVADLQIPWALLLTVNPLCILLFAPLLDLVWRRQARKGTAPSSLTKMAVSWLLVTIAFVVMVVAAKLTGAGRASPVWPLFSTALLTIGELTFVPIGLSLLTKIAPARGVSTMMAVWMLLTLFGNVASGYLGVVCAQWSNEELFVMLTVLGIGGSAVMWACKKPLSRAIGDEG